MIDKSKKKNKGTISEEDISTVLHRYGVNTVLALLQEVAHVAGDKIDWNEMVKNTSTGISCAREYQTLWRHLAYGQNLSDQIDQGEVHIDDDSDLEHEMEAVPAVSREASAEAAACVKVLIASVPPKDFDHPNNLTIEAPLIINIPNNKPSVSPSDSSILASSMHGTNISIPVFVPKLPLTSGTCGEKRPNTETIGVNFPPRRKRRAWSSEDDMKLTASVEKYGERNWANIARGDFKNDRKASELSQRWANIRKKQGNSKVGTSSQHSETQLAAAHRAMSLALDMPMGDMKPTSQISNAGTRPPLQAQKPSASLADQHVARSGPLKSQFPTKKLPSSMNPISMPDSMVKAAAVAAGARIVTSADASSLIDVARSQNVVHITTGGTSGIKPSSTTSLKSQLPSNVHFIRNGLAKAPISTYTAAKPTIISRTGEAQVHSIKPTQSSIQPNQVGPSPVQNVSKLAKTAEEAVVERNNGGESSSQSEVEKHETCVSDNALKENSRENQTSISLKTGPNSQTQDDRVALPCSELETNGKKSPDDQHARKEIKDSGPNRREIVDEK